MPVVISSSKGINNNKDVSVIRLLQLLLPPFEYGTAHWRAVLPSPGSIEERATSIIRLPNRRPDGHPPLPPTTPALKHSNF
ncbi:hypothetical protein DAPPUDRAFT_236688 [Daphnia pulex]|uniref:Uncharacterized protein n=1 Tax=Daphnia pulex TaxID=6669 RepID=E9G2W3_DAPPU|nr:hypothetical protein DAPPUDRAFT_236688 [Daphnia pulex]|eukprot:EFX86437.1 hypothetical protein DAPPUDRAFT_236688 [Daphnia pulex]